MYLTSGTSRTYFTSNYISYTRIIHIPKPQYAHMHTDLKPRHIRPTGTPSTKYQFSSLKAFPTPVDISPYPPHTPSRLPHAHTPDITHTLPPLPTHACTHRAHVYTTTRLYFSPRSCITGTQTCPSYTQTSHTPGIPISPPCSNTEDKPHTGPLSPLPGSGT